MLRYNSLERSLECCSTLQAKRVDFTRLVHVCSSVRLLHFGWRCQALFQHIGELLLHNTEGASHRLLPWNVRVFTVKESTGGDLVYGVRKLDCIPILDDWLLETACGW